MSDVREAMSRKLVTVTRESTVWEAAELAARSGVRHLLVISDRHLIGVLGLCDLDWAERCVAVHECMSRPVFTVHESASLNDAASIMSQRAVGCLPVIKAGRV